MMRAPRSTRADTLFPDPTLFRALSGIYATRVHGVGGRPWPSVSSFGTRPTVGGVEPLLEANLFDFDGDLYGRRIEVEFVAKLRDEEKVPDLQTMVEKMDRRTEENTSEIKSIMRNEHAVV